MKRTTLQRLITCAAALVLGTSLCAGQTDSTRHFSANAMIWTRGEIRDGALPADNGADYAAFLMGNSIVKLDYTSPWLAVRFAPKYIGVWGASTTGALSIDEAWLTLQRKGFFARMGRQRLSYDDQRIIGADDWAMAPKTHDAVKLGYESRVHKVHLLLAFNQNNENLNGGTRYVNGGQAYKTMQMLWYHVDPLKWLGASVIGMNMGMQSLLRGEDKTRYQQLFGTFLDLHPASFNLQASYYRQTGETEYSLPIHAWIASVEAKWKATSRLNLTGGYFHMSGDPGMFVPVPGAIGMTLKTEVRGFNPMFGSHHKFYGAMDFFYVTTYYGGNTPGLQDLHIGAKWSPVKQLILEGAIHYLATSVLVSDTDTKALGHEYEGTLSWKLAPDVTLQAGFSLMNGTETMTRLKRTSDQNQLRWAWLMVIVTPEFFKI